MSTKCPGCGGSKSKRAGLCADCRRRANEIGASVITHVATPASPVVPRTPQQNSAYHGRLRDIALLEKPGLERDALWSAERQLKKWALKQASKLVGREVGSSTELNELEFELLLDYLGDVMDAVRAGEPRPR